MSSADEIDLTVRFCRDAISPGTGRWIPGGLRRHFPWITWSYGAFRSSGRPVAFPSDAQDAEGADAPEAAPLSWVGRGLCRGLFHGGGVSGRPDLPLRCGRHGQIERRLRHAGRNARRPGPPEEKFRQSEEAAGDPLNGYCNGSDSSFYKGGHDGRNRSGGLPGKCSGRRDLQRAESGVSQQGP